jgi:hypothetical protein
VLLSLRHASVSSKLLCCFASCIQHIVEHYSSSPKQQVVKSRRFQATGQVQGRRRGQKKGLVTKREPPALAHPLALKALQLEMGCRNGRRLARWEYIFQRATVLTTDCWLVTGSLMVIIIAVIITWKRGSPLSLRDFLSRQCCKILLGRAADFPTIIPPGIKHVKQNLQQAIIDHRFHPRVPYGQPPPSSSRLVATYYHRHHRLFSHSYHDPPPPYCSKSNTSRRRRRKCLGRRVPAYLSIRYTCTQLRQHTHTRP